jgi:hypothetical protein
MILGLVHTNENSDMYNRPVFPLGGWQSIVLTAIVFIFRNETSGRLRIGSGRHQARIRTWIWKRSKAYIETGLALWLLADIGKLFVMDTIQIGDSDYRRRGS